MWAKELAALVGRIKAELGCDSAQGVTCELYKLLLYEPGGFFKVCPNRDRLLNPEWVLVVVSLGWGV